MHYLLACRALGRHLVSERARLEMDVEQWKAHAAELGATAEAERSAWEVKQAEVDGQMAEIKELLEAQVGAWGSSTR